MKRIDVLCWIRKLEYFCGKVVFVSTFGDCPKNMPFIDQVIYHLVIKKNIYAIINSIFYSFDVFEINTCIIKILKVRKKALENDFIALACK